MTERTRSEQPTVSLGAHADAVTDAVTRLESDNVVSRILVSDHSVWRSDPTEITDRLGWLTIIAKMRDEVRGLRRFANEVRDDGIHHVVLLGMGGSSLGPEVIRRTFGSAPGFPELIVLDSTLPRAIIDVGNRIDPARTLFLVSSKSGSTIEPNSLYKHFRDAVEAAGAKGAPGDHFAAITDPGTSLAALAHTDGFRRLFENPPDIGGRYSVLSFFGLVPAALIGVDVDRLLDSASAAAADANSAMDIQRNPSAWLGAMIGAMAGKGLDKLTVVTSPSVASFGLWAEQLLAESTGKEGTGVIPIAGEPVLDPDAYGEDRVFVYLRVEGDDNAENDVATERLAAVGHPVVRLSLADTYGICGEFFRWEFATAVIGAILDIHPFDQPNVQAAKDATNRVLADYATQGSLPAAEAGDSLAGLLAGAKPGDYLVIMPYAKQTDGVDTALAQLRRQIMKRHRVATTVGYGPRFLHSTGQLHKGGPNTGLFLQLIVTHDPDLGIPGERFSFGTLADAQALGDLQALLEAGRRVARVHLGGDAEGGLLHLLAGL